MSLDRNQLRAVPMLAAMQDQELDALADQFVERQIEEGVVLFHAGDEAETLAVLTAGEIGLYEGADLRFRLQAIAVIGELGVLTDLHRNTTARALSSSVIWEMPRETLVEFLANNCSIAGSFYRSMLQIVADKARRDQLRIEDMRSNLIRTQKQMKRLRDLVLQSHETPISEPIHEVLDELIAHNRRVNYRVDPPPSMPIHLHLDDGRRLNILELSRTHVLVDADGDVRVKPDESLTAVVHLLASKKEFPISGRVIEVDEERFELELDFLIESYSDILDDYLTRAQMLDFVV